MKLSWDKEYIRSPRIRSRLRPYLAALLSSIVVLIAAAAQPESKRITIYANQTSYSAPILDRNNIEYVGLIEALEPLGPVSARSEGKKWRFTFRNVEAQFEVGKPRFRVRGKNFDLPSQFLFENGHGFVPAASLRQIMPLFEISQVDYHEAAHRLFIGSTVVHVTARKVDNAKVAFVFSAPVSPLIVSEAGRMRMIFERDALQGDSKPVVFDDKAIASATYSESNGAAELVITGSVPMTSTLSDDHRLITVSAVVPQPQAMPAQVSSSVPQVSELEKRPPVAQEPAPAPKPHPYVAIDAAHGGADRGAMVGPKLFEKDVNLAIAQRIRHELELRGISSILVRDGDYSVSFEQRASTTNNSGAELYLSLHTTSAGVGIRIYYSGITPQSRTSLAFVPVQTVQASQATQSRSSALAIAQGLAARDLQVSALPGTVPPLNSVAIPAISIEMSPRELGAEELGTGAYQQFVAGTISAAIAATQPQKSREVSR